MDKKPDTANGLDPDLAELLSLEEEPPARPAPAARRPSALHDEDPRRGGREGEPDFGTLFADEQETAPSPADGIDASRKKFEPIKNYEEAAKPLFVDKNHYRAVLSGEGEAGQRVHDLVTKFMKATDPEEKSGHRARLIMAFWELAGSIAGRVGREIPMPKRLLLRYGVLSPSFLSAELRDMLCRIVWENHSGEPVHYVDEWLEKIAKGQVRPSSTDEVKVSQRDTSQKMMDALEKRRGQRESEVTILRGKVAQLEDREKDLYEQVKLLLHHETREDFGGLKASFSPSQKAACSAILDILRSLGSLDGQIASSYAALRDMDEDLESLARKSEGITASSAADPHAAAGEFPNIRQMAKLCVGRKGNHFPILLAQYVRPNIREIGTRENVLTEMAAVEALDPGLFLRTFKQQTTRIVPNVILVPGYGETGICWEPFEKFNRSTSRGRIAIPLYPTKSLRIAVLAALADLRWQVAKEKAQYYWMEEGITGKYYQWFDEHKLRGDVREYFIRDYILWITMESQGMQKLDRDIRGIFWRLMPFPQETKDALKNRGFFYSELYKKDQNIAMSDGY
jgi:hypothetical protein